jgi:hypothetical protein
MLTYNGKEKALKVFSDLKVNFARDGLYIFAYHYEGTSRIDAKFGNGFFYYIYPDSSKNMTPALKLGYAVDVDGTWYLGSGIYAKSEK